MQENHEELQTFVQKCSISLINQELNIFARENIDL